jgi:CRISPR-associated protein (TIGR03984 family)
MTKLYWQASRENITLQDVIKLIHQKNPTYLDHAIGLIYSLKKCCFIKINGVNIEQPPEENEEKAVDIHSIFEARIFNENLELRWLNEQHGKGKAVLLSDKELDLCLEIQPDALEILATQTQRYLLWGEATDNADNTNDGWNKLISSRIGFIYVPYVNHRVYLQTREYFKEDNYGNVSVIEERLMSLEVK